MTLMRMLAGTRRDADQRVLQKVDAGLEHGMTSGAKPENPALKRLTGSKIRPYA